MLAPPRNEPLCAGREDRNVLDADAALRRLLAERVGAVRQVLNLRGAELAAPELIRHRIGLGDESAQRLGKRTQDFAVARLRDVVRLLQLVVGEQQGDAGLDDVGRAMRRSRLEASLLPPLVDEVVKREVGQTRVREKPRLVKERGVRPRVAGAA